MKHDASSAWFSLIEEIIYNGAVTNEVKRGEMNSGVTKEVLAYRSIVDMHRPVLAVPQRKLNYRFMAGEAWWILSGRNDVASICEYNKVMAKFSDDGETFFGAYGPRIEEQMAYVVGKLVQDNQSRQAVMTIWRPNPPHSRDIPCTIAIQFLIRDGHLYCIDTMRSSDAWLGWPYDVFNFSMLSIVLAIRLRGFGVRVELGSLYLIAGSAHLYERDMEKAIACTASSDTIKYDHFHPAHWNSVGDLLDFLKRCADGQTPLIRN